MITAPFNFVPIAKEVFFPNWASEISHDIPFEDGESGIIKLKMTAETPLFICNGHTKKDGEKDDAYKSFSKINDKYFIPGTSIKGAIRNVLEIMSFGKMRLDKSSMFAQREWDNETLYPMKQEQSQVFCGYLRQQGENYEIVDCGKPYRIGHKRIDERIDGKVENNIFENKFSKEQGIDLTKEYQIGGNNFNPKTATFKYELIKTNNEIISIQNFDIDEEFCNEYKDNRLQFSNTGKYSGRLVLTGQPDKWTWPRPIRLTKDAGKYYEFVFLEPEEANLIPLPKEQFNHFKFIYMESPEWERAKKLLESEGIPVFFRKTKQGDIWDLGLAFLYKLPYDHSPFDTLYKDHKNETDPDLADCIFGFTDLKHHKTNEKHFLKGRVQFSPAFSENAEPDDNVILTLNSPKASYYPLYIQQNGQNSRVTEYKTYNDGVIAGWKRYMVRKNIWGHKTEAEYNSTLDTIIHPVKTGAVFTGKLRFHNLKKIELGALLSALTFHNTDGCYHQLGQGKPYGFGKMKLEILEIKLSSNQDAKPIELMERFEEHILKKIKNWNETEQIKELFTIAKQEVDANDLFKYMHMDNDKTKNEFLSAKNFKEFMDKYSVLTNVKITPISLVKSKYDELLKASNSLKELQQYEEAKKLLEEAKTMLPYGNEHKDILNDIDEILQQQQKEEIERKKQEEIELNRQKKIDGGLSFLDEKNLKGEYKVIDFKGAKNRIDQWIKKAHVQLLPQEQWNSLYTCIYRLKAKSDKNEKKLWGDINSSIWKKIQEYVGFETSERWFNLLIKNEKEI